MAKSGASLNWGGLDKVVERATGGLASRRRDMLNAIGEALVSGTLERFENEESPDGKKWEPSGRAWTQGLKSRRGRMGKTLQDTGRLRSSIDYAVTADSVLVGSEVEYARIHQMGGRAGRGHTVKIPARPYLGVSKADKAEIKAIMLEFMENLFGG